MRYQKDGHIAYLTQGLQLLLPFSVRPAQTDAMDRGTSKTPASRTGGQRQTNGTKQAVANGGKLIGIDPYDWFTDLLSCIANHKKTPAALNRRGSIDMHCRTVLPVSATAQSGNAKRVPCFSFLGVLHKPILDKIAADKRYRHDCML